MPGEFIEEVHIYQCGTHADGTAIYCSEIGYAKIPFESFESEDPSSVGWRQRTTPIFTSRWNRREAGVPHHAQRHPPGEGAAAALLVGTGRRQ
jgi:hypothetical protein